MYSAPFIRKEMLRVLESSIIPALQNQSTTHLLGEPPFDFSHLEHRILDKTPLPDKTYDKRQVLWQWKEQRMVCARMPYLAYVYEGAAEVRLGATQQQALEHPTASLAGIYALRLPAPFSLYHSPMTPRGDGSPFSYHPQQEPGHRGTLLIHWFADEILPSLNVINKHGVQGTHPLQIHDPYLSLCGQLYADELKHGEPAMAHTTLLVFMTRLQRYLKSHRAALSNSCWAPPEHFLSAKPTPSLRANEICYEVMDYIQTHLDHKLSRERLAAQFKISDVHLNRVFCQTAGVSVMRYVTLQRINAAKLMLNETDESIETIARFTGFAGASSLGTVFHRHTGKSPSTFRHDTRHKE